MGDGEVTSWQKVVEYGTEEGNSARRRKIGFFDSGRVRATQMVSRAKEDGGTKLMTDISCTGQRNEASHGSVVRRTLAIDKVS